MNEQIERTDAVVVGAGLAGLAAAQLLRREGLRVVVLDPGPPGGRGRTDDHDGFLWNRGPHALYLSGAAERVLRDLGVRWSGSAPGALHLRDGHVVGVGPSGAATLLRSPFLGWRGRAALAGTLTRLPRIDAGALAGRSLAEWIDSLRLPTDARRLLTAIARVSTYTNAPDITAADMVVAQLQQTLAHGVRYLDGGWQVLVDQLAKDIDVRPCAATAVGRDGDDVVVATAGMQFVADAAVLAVADPAGAAALLGRAPFDVGPSVDAACLDLGTDRVPSAPVLLGLDEPLYLSDHGSAARLAPERHTVVHVARYLTPGEHHDHHDTRAQLMAHAAAAGLPAEAVAASRYLHRMTVVGALATAAQGGLPGRPRTSGVAGVELAGDWVGPHGHLLDASMSSAAAAAAAVLHRSGR